MRGVFWAKLQDKTRPVLVLTRNSVIPRMTKVTVAPITSTIRGISTEVPVGAAEGLDHDSVVSCDNIITIDKSAIISLIGHFDMVREQELSAAISAAFDLM